MIYGYARVSTKSQEDNTSLYNQENQLRKNGCEVVVSEVFTGATMNRPKFVELEKKLKKGDTLMITTLDRFSRSTEKGIEKIKELAEKEIIVNILNLGVIDLKNPMGKMVFTVLSAFSEYEKDCIIERMREGKQIAKQNPNFREGRPKKFNKYQIELAMSLLKNHSYREVSKMTGISKSTLIRAKRKEKDE